MNYISDTQASHDFSFHEISQGITCSFTSMSVCHPLLGTNVHEAQKILNNSGLPITSAVNLEDAAKKAVASVAKKWCFCHGPLEEEVHFCHKNGWFSLHYEGNGYLIGKKYGMGKNKNHCVENLKSVSSWVRNLDSLKNLILHMSIKLMPCVLLLFYHPEPAQ